MSYEIIERDFQGTPIRLVRDGGGELLLTVEQMAVGLGYARADDVNALMREHADELRPFVRRVDKRQFHGAAPSNPGRARVTALTKTGFLLLSMHARTERAGEFRLFLVHIVEELDAGRAAFVDSERVVALATLVQDLATDRAALHEELRITNERLGAIEAGQREQRVRLEGYIARTDRVRGNNTSMAKHAAAILGIRGGEKRREDEDSQMRQRLLAPAWGTRATERLQGEAQAALDRGERVTVAELARRAGVARSTVRRQAERHPTLRDLIDRATGRAAAS